MKKEEVSFSVRSIKPKPKKETLTTRTPDEGNGIDASQELEPVLSS